MEKISEIYLSVAVAFLTIILLFKYIKNLKTKKKLPPGPSFTLPFLGNLLQLGKKPHLTFSKWGKLYGPLVYWKMANMNTVLVSDVKLLKELFSHEATTDRLRNLMFDIYTERQGLSMSDGRTWAEQRHFAVKTLQGLSKGGTLESIILEEGSRLVRFFEQHVNSPLEMKEAFMGALLNSIWALTSGESHDWIENPDLAHIKIITEFSNVANRTVETGLWFAPWLRHIIPEMSGFSEFIKTSDKFKRLAEHTVHSHLAENNSTRTHDFIGEYLAYAEGVTDPESSFFGEVGRKNLRMDLVDLLMAGSETTASTLECAMLYLSAHPHVQVEIQKELDSVIGSERLPSLMDKLPYTEAVMLEILRRSSVVPMGLPHQTSADIELHGYTIPKGTTLFANVYGIHMNKDIWTDPENFRPERFLNEDKTQVVRREALIPFSVGKRHCIGETMAKNTVFLVVACLMQHFTLEACVQNIDLDDLVPGFILKPKPFKVIFKMRK